MLRAILALLKRETSFIPEEERQRISNQIKEHVALEEKAIKTYSEIIEKLIIKRSKQYCNIL